jgi:1,4-alpha-glucan branching enzyme
MRKKKSVPCLGLALFSCLLLSCGGAAASASLFSSAFSEPVSSSVSSNSPSSEVASSSSEEDFDPTNAIGLEKGDGDYHLSDAISNKNSSFSYEIFVRSFYDADGDGVGDFAGVSAKADYLQSLGVGQVWLLPVYPSPTYHGYDIADYYSLNSDYGNLSQFADMLNNLHAHNIKVYLDMVLNHSSIKNPYFVQAKEDFINDNQAADSMKDWYNFYYDKNGNVAYECRFDSSMPDFNFDSAGVQAEFKKF